jgi:hypothetical protein
VRPSVPGGVPNAPISGSQATEIANEELGDRFPRCQGTAPPDPIRGSELLTLGEEPWPSSPGRYPAHFSAISSPAILR